MFSLVQETHDFTYATGQKSLTFSGNITKGNTLLAWCISTDSASSNHPTIDGGYDLTWVPILSQIDTGGYGYLSAWYAVAKRSRACTVLIYGSNGVGSVAANLTEPSCQMMEWSGNSTNPFVVSIDASGTGTTASANLVASSPVGLVVGIIVPTTAAVDGVETTGWTNAVAPNTKASAIYAIESGTGTFTPKYSLTNSGEWGILAIGFRVPGSTYTISGSLGSAGANASVLFASNTTQAVVFATADGSGNYTSPALENDTYIVIPQVAGSYFAPYSQTQVVSGANITGLNFTGTAVRTDLYFSENWYDSMQRANESPLSFNGFWSENGTPVPPYDAPLAIVSDEGTFSSTTIVANDAAPWKADAVSVWAGHLLPPDDQWMEIQIDALNSNPGAYATAFAEVRSANDNTYCYRLAIQNNGDGTAQLSVIANYTSGLVQLPPVWENANGQQSYGAATVNVAFSLGDTIRYAIIGSVLYIYHNGTLVANFNDTDITSGTFCLELTGKSTSDIQVSHFKSGAVALQTEYYQLATDNFARSTESPLSDGGNWAEPDATNYLILTAPQEVNASTNAICVQYYNGGISWPSNHYSEVTVGPNFSSASGPAVRCQAGTRNCYCIIFTNSGNFQIQSQTNGTGSILASTTGVTYTAGDVLRLEVVGTTLTAKHNGATLLTTTDSKYSGGFPGLLMFFADVTNGFMGPWNGGLIAGVSGLSISPSSVTYPSTATGTVTIVQSEPVNVTVLLSSSDTTVATVPSSVTVLAGQTTATFTVTSLNKTGSATITATLGGTATASISVTAEAGGEGGSNPPRIFNTPFWVKASAVSTIRTGNGKTGTFR